MLRVAIVNALPGMRLALPIQHPQRGTMLLSAGFALDDIIIRKLHQMEVHTVWIEYPDTEQIKQYVSPAILNQQSQLVGVVADLLDEVHREAHAEIEFEKYRKAIQGLIENLVNDPAAAAYIVEMGGAGANDLRHASEVCFLSVLLGLKLQGYLIQQRRRLLPKDARDVVSLGVGAMLHDIGMTALPADARARWYQAPDENDRQWRQHPALGHKMLSGSIPPAAAGVVLHHHQYFDGSGFPTSIGADGRPVGLAGEDIHVYARIVCVANHFDRLRRPPVKNGSADGRGDEPRVRVLKAMIEGPLSQRFDPVVLAALPLVVPAYPPGSLVTLSNAARAVVVDWHPEAPCQPTVQVLADPPCGVSKNIPAPVRYDLRQQPNLKIVEADGIDVSADNFRLISRASPGQKDAA